MRCDAAYVVMRCLCVCVCVSVTLVSYVKTNKDIFKIFSPSGNHTILVFPYQTGWQYCDGNPPNGGVECRWSRQKCKSWRALRPVAGQAFHWLTDWLTDWLMLCISAAYAVMRCVSLSVCVSVTFVNCVKTNKHIIKLFHRRVDPLLFSMPNGIAIFRQESPLWGRRMQVG